MSKQVVKVGNSGWAPGTIVEDRALYGPSGVEKVDTIQVTDIATNKSANTQTWVLVRNILLIVAMLTLTIVVEVLNISKANSKTPTKEINTDVKV